MPRLSCELLPNRFEGNQENLEKSDEGASVGMGHVRIDLHDDKDSLIDSFVFVEKLDEEFPEESETQLAEGLVANVYNSMTYGVEGIFSAFSAFMPAAVALKNVPSTQASDSGAKVADEAESESVDKSAAAVVAKSSSESYASYVSSFLSQVKWPTQVQGDSQKEAIDKFIKNNSALMAALSQPGDLTITNDPGLIEKLKDHAILTHKSISVAELSRLVVVGENIAKALAAQVDLIERGGDVKSASPTIGGDDGNLNIPSNPYTVRALCWYMMASAATQDILRAKLDPNSSTSDMVTFGSILMKDPHHVIYNFLNNNEHVSHRTSSHFPERIGHDDKHSFFSVIPTGQSAQRGIEDYEGLLPGHGGALLFDKLKEDNNNIPELFVKFELVGCPNWIDYMDGGSDKSYFSFSAVNSFLSGVSRNTQHALEFISTRMQSDASKTEIVRQEHLYKGVLKKLFDKLNIFFKGAYVAGVEKRDIEADMKKFGLPAALREIERVRVELAGSEWADLVNVDKMLMQVKAATDELGRVSDRHGIERRGAEVHISLNPTDVAAALSEVPV